VFLWSLLKILYNLFSLSPQFGDLQTEYHPILTNNLTILCNFQNWGKLVEMGQTVSQVRGFVKLGQNWVLTSGQTPPILDAWRRGRPDFGLLAGGGQSSAVWLADQGIVAHGDNGGAASRPYVSHAARLKPRGLSHISPT